MAIRKTVDLRFPSRERQYEGKTCVACEVSVFYLCQSPLKLQHDITKLLINPFKRHTWKNNKTKGPPIGRTVEEETPSLLPAAVGRATACLESRRAGPGYGVVGEPAPRAWVSKSQWAEQLRYLSGPDSGLWIGPHQYLPTWWTAGEQEGTFPTDPQL